MAETSTDNSDSIEAEAADPAFERLLNYLRDSRSFDFTGYKRPSLMRRVQHQMRRVQIDSFDDYLDFLQVHPDEFRALFDTILINVTSFFRDSDAWEYLRDHEVPRLLERADDPIRLWSAGCATGQEAYSLAMLLADSLGIEPFRERVKIYATDVDEEALAIGRAATYTERQVQDIPARYRDRYLEKLGDSFAIVKELRRCVIFGRNDLVQDAPISRIDLLACRNLLMYFNAETQGRVVNRLAFALRPSGLLFLGKAEMLLNHVGTFEPVDLKRRFFRKLRGAQSELASVVGADLQDNGAHRRDDGNQQLQVAALLNTPSPTIVLDTSDRVVLINHRAAALFGMSESDVGRPFQDLEVSFRPAELRSHLAQVHQTRPTTRLRNVSWRRTPHELVYFDIQLAPLLSARASLIGILITFNDVTQFRELHLELEQSNRQLESAYEELQSTNEELETTNEELQSTVEELETTNEELQSTNEELETMNEELQSMNDELQVTNENLRERTAEIGHLNELREAVLASLGSGVVVVDESLWIQAWNRQAEDMWGVRESEVVGTQLLELDTGLPTEDLRPLVRAALSDSGRRVEKTLQAVNRRGRPVTVQISVSGLQSAGRAPTGAVIVMATSERTG